MWCWSGEGRGVEFDERRGVDGRAAARRRANLLGHHRHNESRVVMVGENGAILTGPNLPSAINAHIKSGWWLICTLPGGANPQGPLVGSQFITRLTAARRRRRRRFMRSRSP